MCFQNYDATLRHGEQAVARGLARPVPLLL
jgi:hypothetical protein